VLLAGAVVLGALALGCTAITGDFSNVIGILYTGPATPTVEEADTVTLTAVALDVNGNPLPDVPVIWRVLALDTATVRITLDSLTGLVTGVSAGTARVQGDAEGLRTNTITVTVLAVPDSIAGVEPTTDTVAVDADESAPLVAAVYDIPPSGVPTPLGGRLVRYAVVSPAPGTPEAAQVAIGLSGQPVGDDSLTALATTSVSGFSYVTARRIGPVQPDSAVVEAVALLSDSTPISGPPARFVVVFVSN